MPILTNLSVLEWGNAAGEAGMWDGNARAEGGMQSRQGKAFLWLFWDLLSLGKAGAWLECVSLNLL